MKTIKIMVPAFGDFRAQVIPLGKMGDGRGDTSIRQIVFDCSQLVRQYGAGTAEILHQRSGDTAPYICDVDQDGATVIWDISKSDTAMAGNGQAELRWYVGSSVQKTTHYQTLTSIALKADAEPPSPFKPWVDKVMEAAKQIMQGGVDTETLNQAIRQAVVDYLANNNIDAGLSEDEVKSIAEDALATYWNAHKDELKGDKGDTGATGPQGPKGDTGATGQQGPKGDPGQNYNLTAQDKAEIAALVNPGGGGTVPTDASQISYGEGTVESALNGLSEEKDKLTQRVKNLENRPSGSGNGATAEQASTLLDLLRFVLFEEGDVTTKWNAVVSAWGGDIPDVPSEPEEPTYDPVSVAWSGTTATIDNLKNLTVSYSGTVATVGGA